MQGNSAGKINPDDVSLTQIVCFNICHQEFGFGIYYAHKNKVQLARGGCISWPGNDLILNSHQLLIFGVDVQFFDQFPVQRFMNIFSIFDITTRQGVAVLTVFISVNKGNLIFMAYQRSDSDFYVFKF